MASLILDSAPLIKTYALMDPSTTQLSIARKKLRRHHDVDIQFLPSTIENSAINEQSYDYIISFASLHHWNDPVIGIRTRMKLCREKVVIIDGIRNQSFSNIHRRIKSLGGGIISTAIYWIGSQDALTHDQLTAITSSFDDVNTANDDDLSYKIEFSKTGHAK
jgi:2-polyprenyl-3-methyl-5-hydroxy-6-metoxy-1,4-benzoquinol methylase